MRGRTGTSALVFWLTLFVNGLTNEPVTRVILSPQTFSGRCGLFWETAPSAFRVGVGAGL
jgi:hypothetical protein